MRQLGFPVGHAQPSREVCPPAAVERVGLLLRKRRRTGASASGVAALYHKVGEDAVEHRVVVIALHAQLHEVATCLCAAHWERSEVVSRERSCQQLERGARLTTQLVIYGCSIRLDVWT